MTGKPVHELLHGAAAGNRKCGADCPLGKTAHMRKAAEMRKAAAGETILYRGDGTAFPAEYVITPLVHDESDFDEESNFNEKSQVEMETCIDGGRYMGFVIHFRDISQRMALDRMKDEFISTLSHELRTPLTSIRGALGLLSSGMHGPMDEKASKLLRIALTNSDRLVRLVNDILDLERIQSGRVPPAFRPVQLGEIVRQAIDGMEPIADAAGVRLMYQVAQAEVAADPDRLLQVLTNLLSNAVKFSPPESTVSVALEPAGEGVTLSVTDQGRGIPSDKLDAIFGRFQQVDADDSRQKGGSGLGLAICRTIVQQHSGRIWAERNPECGSTFRVFLPWQPAPLESPSMGDSSMGGRATKMDSPIGMLPFEVKE
jgi:signal transduction histidine kinase